MSRLVIGLGFRDEASAQSIGEVLAAVAGRAGFAATAIAVPGDKAGHTGLRAAAREAELPIEAIGADAMRRADTQVATRSERSEKHRGVGSVCEAAALAAAGAGARLVATRIVSTDRHATAAAAIARDLEP